MSLLVPLHGREVVSDRLSAKKCNKRRKIRMKSYDQITMYKTNVATDLLRKKIMREKTQSSPYTLRYTMSSSTTNSVYSHKRGTQ